MNNELPNTPSGLMHLLPSTSSQINVFANSIVQAVRRGDENPLDVLLQIRAMEKAFEIILDNIKGNALTEADKYPGDKFFFKGNEVSKADVYTKYNYDACGDTEYERLASELKMISGRLKERETFLRSLQQPMTVADELTGEVVRIKPPLKNSTPGLKISIK